MTGSYKTVRRFTILGGCVAAFVLIDGLVLLVTNGLSSDATPVFPMLGGGFSKTHSSGASLIILGIILAVVSFAGWWTLGRRLRAAERHAATGTQHVPGQHASAESTAVSQHDG